MGAIIHSLKYFLLCFLELFFFSFFFRSTSCVRAFRFSSALTLQLRMFFSFFSLSLSSISLSFRTRRTRRTNERTNDRKIGRRLIHGWRVRLASYSPQQAFSFFPRIHDDPVSVKVFSSTTCRLSPSLTAFPEHGMRFRLRLFE